MQTPESPWRRIDAAGGDKPLINKPNHQESKMNTVTRIIAASIFAVLSTLGLHNTAKADPVWNQIQKTGKIVCGAIPNDPLGSWIDPKTHKWEGYEIDLCREISADLSKAMGKKITPEFRETTWATVVLDIQSRKIDIWPGMSATPDREKALSMIGPMYDLAFCTVNRKGFDVGQNWNDFNNPKVRIATITGTSIETAFKKFAPNATQLTFSGLSEVALAVQSGRADVMGTDALRCLNILKSTPQVFGRVVFPKPFKSIGSSAGLIKGTDKLSPWLTQWTAQHRANDAIKSIFVKVMDKAGFDTSIIPPELKF
jgi:polar amino acid transport system substrate-binding protein